MGVDAPAGSGSRLFRGRPEDTASLSTAVLAAYQRAVAASPPECHLSVSLLAAIGQVESGNLAGHRLDAGNRVVPAILGPVLNGRGFRAVPDTDAGHLDGNTRWDRAVGPLQLIPSTWRAVGVDLDGDGVRDPQDLYDAAGAAMVYLCAGGRDLATEEGLRAAILSYNHSTSYLRLVLAWKAAFESTDLAAWATATLEAQAAPRPAASTAPHVPGTPAGHTRHDMLAGAETAITALPHAPVPPTAASPPPPTTTTSTATSTMPALPSGPTSAPEPVPDPLPTPPTETCTAPPPTQTPVGDPTQPGDPTSTTPSPEPAPAPSPGESTQVPAPTPPPDPCSVVPAPPPAPDPTPDPAPEPPPAS